jgi:tetratricopeptide (TPR) repeat protein
VGGALVTCARCGAGVELPANYCDMCGGRIAPRPAADLRRRPEPAAARPEQHSATPGGTVSEQGRGTRRVDPEAARRSLTSACRTIKNIEKTIDSVETSENEGSAVTRIVDRFRSGRRLRAQMADLHRTLDLARAEAAKAANLDSDSVIDTDDGPLTVRALGSLVDRVAGTIELLAGKPRAAIRHYQSSIETLETRDGYLDMAFAYERVGQPGKALSAYERCTALAPDGEADVFAEDEIDRLRSKMILGGWFVGSWLIVAALVYLAALSLLSLLLFPFAGKVALAACASGLVVYLWANFRRPVRSNGRERRSPKI